MECDPSGIQTSVPVSAVSPRYPKSEHVYELYAELGWYEAKR